MIDPRIFKKAKKIYKEKLVLENILRKELKIYFAKCKKAIASGHSLPDCAEVIKSNAERTVKSVLNKPIKSIDTDKYSETLNKKNKKTVNVHINSINKTNEKRLKTALSNAREELKDDNGNESAVNKTAANIFDQSAQKRIGVIAITETGSLTNETRLNLYDESSDDLEQALDDEDYDTADEIAELNDSTVMEDGIESHRNGESTEDVMGTVLAGQKTWICMFDNSCDICISLHGQTVALEDQFTDLNGDTWDSPDDGIHINCQCDIVL